MRFLLLLVALISSPTFCARGLPDDAWTKGPPAKEKPSVPGWGYYAPFPKAWLAMHETHVERSRQGGVNVVFIGDSITQGWGDTGKSVWEARFAPLGAVNYGIGGDSTRQVLWRIDHGALDGIQPRAVVLAIGTNNLYSDHNDGSDEEIAEGIGAVVKAVRAKLPAAHIVLAGILPRQNEYFSGRIRKINKLIAPLADANKLSWVDATDSFAESLGKVKPALYDADQLHLNAAGYATLAEILAPVLR